MASKLPHCDICSLRGILEPATVWCSECDESICSECKQHHGLCKATRSHRTLPIEDFLKLPAFVREFNLRCEEHDEKLELFCSIHAVPCCLKCVKLKHEKCRDIKPFHATEQPIKSSASFSDLKSICIELDDYYQGIEIKLEQIKSIKLLDNLALQIMKTVKDMKKDVLKHLDDLEQKAIDDIPKKKEQLAENIVKFTTAIYGRWGRVKNFLTQLQRIEQHAQEHKILLGLHKLEKEIQSEKSFIQYFKGNPGLIQFEMEFVPSIDFTTSFKLGKINIMSDLMIPAHNTFDNETLEHIQAELPTVVYNNPIFCTSKVIPNVLDLLPNNTCFVGNDSRDGGHILKTVFLFNRISSLFLNAYYMYWLPEHAIYIGVEKMVVLFGSTNKMCIYNMATKTMESAHNCDTSSVKSNIVYKNDKLYYIDSFSVGLCNDSVSLQLRIFDFIEQSESIKTFGQQGIKNDCELGRRGPVHISKYKDMNIYFSVKRNIFCFDINGNEIWKKSHPLLTKPVGICCDRNGIVYVLDSEIYSVFGISHDGKTMKVVLDQSAGLKSPTSIKFDPHNNQLIIIDNDQVGHQFDIV